MVKRSYSPARTQAVGIDLGTRRAACFISVRNTVEFTVVISLWHSSAGLRTVDALSIAGLLWQSTRNTYMDSCLSLMTILRDYMRLNIDSLFGLCTSVKLCTREELSLVSLSPVVCMVFVSLDGLLIRIV